MIDLTKWPEADDLLDRALSLPTGEREVFVERVASHDAALAAALRAVLAEATGDDGFLDPGGALSGSLGGEIERSIVDVEEEQIGVLAIGERIEQYAITGFIGRGGMGEVYRARDLRLDRDVALKLLPARFAADSERIARFHREARVLAALSHPGIGAIYGIAEERGIEALVLELVEGPTLADRLDTGALPLDAALTIGRRLADALEAAHTRGILHRDLKPANIKIVGDDGVKILDFGLARILEPAAASVQAPDLSAQAAGVLLGTAAYMSPEQVRSAAVDERADIWAFGCVLFEMLTGTRAFPGTTTHEILARVLEREPAFSLLPSATPEPIRRLLRRTLEKHLDRRLGYIGDAILDFDDVSAPPLSPPRTSPSSWKIAAALAGGIAAGAVGAALMLQPGGDTGRPVSRFIAPLPSGDQPVTGFQPMTALSPDGQTLVYRARRNGVVQLFRRAMRDLDPSPIPGTENATAPFFSPDGRWLGFDGDGVLKRVTLDGSAPVVICPAPGGVTASWMRDDSIVFATNTSRVLQRVPASGGAIAALTRLDTARGDTMHLLPQALPDGRTILFTIVSGSKRHVALRLDNGETRVIAEGTHGRYLDDGILVFSRERSLWGVPFDLSRQSTAGTAVPLVEGIEDTDNTVLHYDVSTSGSMAYLPAGDADTGLQRLTWIDRAGNERAVDLEARPYLRVSLSPDGARIAVSIRERGNTDIWIADPSRRTMSRLTFEPTIETMPTWSPDGRAIAFRSEREGPGLFRRDAQGAAAIERLTSTDGPIHSPYSWTPDGRTLLFALFRSFRSQAIASVTPPDRTVRVMLDGNFAQLDPQVSPNGKWLAYQSDESGRFEVYVRPYPNVEQGRWQISARGGTSPRWGPDGGELLYLDPSGLMTVPVVVDAAFSAGQPRRLFPVKPFGGRLGGDYEVSPDGKRFLFILDGPPAAAGPAHVIVVQNWIEELKERLRIQR
jgi:Tol biopolymer transport system component